MESGISEVTLRSRDRIDLAAGIVYKKLSAFIEHFLKVSVYGCGNVQLFGKITIHG
jgi:hypothetical protein